LAEGWATLSLTDHQAALLYRIFFWTQYVLVLALLVYGTYSNHRHPLFSPLNIFFQTFSPPGDIPLVDFTEEQRFGASRPEELDRKLLLDGFACTHCGRCQDSCPAHDTEKPLSPKQLILDINRCLLAKGSGIPPAIQRDQPSGISMETLLSCTTCGACIEVCPVLNRPLDSIIELRRHLVYEGLFDPGHATTLRRISQDANPWGVRWHRRAQHLDLPTARPNEHYDCLYWLGCTAAFDDRATRIAEAMAAVLKRAGVHAAILGTAEKCCGDAARRIGDEGLFQKLAMDNIKLLNDHDFDFILTHCPHCFNSLTNDYRPLGASFRVIHHSNLLWDLLRSKRIELHPAKASIVYHDPCYLGRYNDVYLAPREVLKTFCSDISEFDRNRANSFCCGAGGGHMWKTTETGQRISVARVKQTLQTAPDQITSACPYCLLMFEEALQTVAPEKPVSVNDIAEAVQMHLR
jgi:Fe-S oxidoreductase